MATIVQETTSLSRPRIEWGPFIAGALVAAAIGTIAIAFGSAIGLSLTSPWPGSGISLWATLIFIAYWSIMVQVMSFAAGGYLSARLRSPATAGEHNSFDDGVHGLLMWAIGVLMMAFLAVFGGTVAAGNASRVVAGAGPAAAAAMSGQRTAANDPSDYAVALLLRPVAGATPGDVQRGDDASTRADLARVFGSVIRNRELTVRDRDYLAQVVSTRTGASQDDARQRVTEAVNEARDLEIRARQAADQARKSAVIAGFSAAVGLLVGLAAACGSAVFGGKQRDEDTPVELLGRRIW